MKSDGGTDWMRVLGFVRVLAAITVSAGTRMYGTYVRIRSAVCMRGLCARVLVLSGILADAYTYVLWERVDPVEL